MTMKTPYGMRMAAMAGAALCAAAQKPDILIADFEGSSYGEWKTEGKAFGTAPAKGTLPGQQSVTGFRGKGLVNSFLGGDGATGTLTSPEFTIERDFIAFLIGGGGHKDKTCMNLLIDGQIARTAAGPNTRPGGSEELAPAHWDLREFLGRQAHIQIVDSETGGWGHINVDHIVQTDTLPPQPQVNVTREIAADKRWLLLPVKNGGRKCRMEVRDGQEVLRFFDIELAEGEPEWWAPLDVGAWQGRTLTLRADKLPAGSKGVLNARLADEPFPAEGVYAEALRPQFHFSSRRGWLNDPNGLVFFNGEYHLFYQHNPYGVNWGNMHWGHAVSTDLVNWQELGIALYPDALGPMFSGCAVVDWNNTSGFGRDGKPPLVLIYTAAGNPATQCIAYSLDGRTFTKYEGNPVVGNITGGNRDPKVFWHAPTARWIMALYVGRPEKLHTVELLASPNLREWTTLSAVPGDKGGGKYLFECPDMFELPVAGTRERRWVLFGADGQYAVGAFDGTVFTPEAGPLGGPHVGSAYYAAQTYSDVPDGRRILIAWLRAPAPGMAFNQCMSVPMELGLTQSAAGVRLTYTPVAELASLREKSQRFGPADLTSGAKNPLAGFEADQIELRLSCDLAAETVLRLEVRGVPLRYDAAKQELTVAKRTMAWPVQEGRLALIVFADRTCIELFSQDGLLYAPLAAVPGAAAKGVTLTVERGAARAVHGEAHALGSCWR
jgi:sucrose-6-phosphate hydrolase SacC (GH32 family)